MVKRVRVDQVFLQLWLIHAYVSRKHVCKLHKCGYVRFYLPTGSEMTEQGLIKEFGKSR